ncbi:MAG: SipW-dependent-type signal peptide-containing protein [Oscillospiraceae bacterium]|nr:SipW-dependent-type signal peptide-containing protein [Oscillospiraceae bacterium]
MKKTKKILALALAAVMLVCTTVAATVAYLQSTDSVTNTFTVGSVEILLDEKDTDGSKTNVTTEGRDKANAYKLYPGKSYEKDPTVTVKGTEEAWLFVKVENGLVDIEAAGNTTIAKQMKAKGWTLVDGETNVFAYSTSVLPGAKPVVFETFTIADTVTNLQLAPYKDAKIIVTAYAVQKEMFSTAQAAWDATFGAPVNP